MWWSLVLCCLSEALLAAGSFVGNVDAAGGTPYQTIQSCVNAAPAQGTCHVQPGTYTETVVVNKGITIEGQPGVMLRGSEVVPDNWSTYKGSIYVTLLPESLTEGVDVVKQVFVDGEFISEARWPNAQFKDVLDVRHWATAKLGTNYGLIYDPDLNNTGVNWNGAIMVLNPDKRVLSFTRKVFNFNGTSFNYSLPLPGEKPRSENLYEGSPYYLFGILDALDTPGEWFVDSSAPGAWKLYVWMPDSGHPGSRVSIRVRDLCVLGTQQVPDAPIILRNMAFNSCTFTLQQCDGCLMQNLNITYPTYIREIAFLEVDRGPMPNITFVYGNNSIVKAVSVKHTNLGGLLLIGWRNRVEDCLIMNTDWLGTLDFPPLQIGFGPSNCRGYNEEPMQIDLKHCGHWLGGEPSTVDRVMGTDNVITRTTVRDFGNSGIVTTQLSCEVSYTHVWNGGLIGCDHAGIHADNLPAPCMYNTSASNCTKHFHHNWVHDCREKCFRGDDATVNFTVSHNVIWNCGTPVRDPRCGKASAGLLIKGDYNVAYANTIFNVTGPGFTAQGDFVPLTSYGPPPPKSNNSQMNKHSKFFNIASHVVTTHGPPLNGSVAYTGAIYQGDYSTYGLVSPTDFNFSVAAGSPLKEAGVVYPPYTSKVDGKNPDIGAVQTGEPIWKPGCSSFPEC